MVCESLNFMHTKEGTQQRQGGEEDCSPRDYHGGSYYSGAPRSMSQEKEKTSTNMQWSPRKIVGTKKALETRGKDPTSEDEQHDLEEENSKEANCELREDRSQSVDGGETSEEGDIHMLRERECKHKLAMVDL